MVIEVAFKGNRREFFEWPFPEAPATRTPVIVEVEHGEDFARVHSTGELALKRKTGTTHGKASPNPLRKVVRAANAEEIGRAAQLRNEELNVRVRAIEKVRTLGLDLKVSDTEWQHDKKRLTVYFTAEQRVDFRQLVRQLEGLFGTRVHMWHIGVRDEAKRVDGLGRCGRQLCSASWLPELVPVKSSVAKDQHLSTLNPAQISGACGRLMCCLRYEHEFYVQQRKRFPKEGKVVKAMLGDEKVLSIDIFRETVTLRSLGGETRVVPLDQLRTEIADAADRPQEPSSAGTPAVGTQPAPPTVEPPAPPGGPSSSDEQATHRAAPREQRADSRPGRHDPRREPTEKEARGTGRAGAKPAGRGGPPPAPPTVPSAPPTQGAGTERSGRRRRRGRRGGRRGHGADGGTPHSGDAAQGTALGTPATDANGAPGSAPSAPPPGPQPESNSGPSTQ